jgi:hypothetical protein
MTNPHDVAGNRSPHAEDAPAVVAVCDNCDHIRQPSPAELGAGPMTCNHCEGWTTIAELAEPPHRN